MMMCATGRGKGSDAGRGRRRTKGVAFVLGASMVGGAFLSLFAGRGERLELSAIPLSDALPPATAVFVSSRKRPQQYGEGDERWSSSQHDVAWSVLCVGSCHHKQSCLCVCVCVCVCPAMCTPKGEIRSSVFRSVIC